MKVLNLYAGIGGNRKSWEDVEVTAVEYDQAIADVYQDLFPSDKVIVADAHEYLLKHYKEYEFIWGSPPCPTHSRLRLTNKVAIENNPQYPDMKLYQEIIFLSKFFEGKYLIENVIPYYEPLIRAHKVGRHLYWSNFKIGQFHSPASNLGTGTDELGHLQKFHGVDLSKYNIPASYKVKMLRNMVNSDNGLYILDCAREIIRKEDTTQTQLF